MRLHQRSESDHRVGPLPVLTTGLVMLRADDLARIDRGAPAVQIHGCHRPDFPVAQLQQMPSAATVRRPRPSFEHGCGLSVKLTTSASIAARSATAGGSRRSCHDRV